MMQKTMLIWGKIVVVMFIMALAAACSSDGAEQAGPNTPASAAVTLAPTNVATAVPPTPTALPLTHTAEPEPAAESAPEPFEVTYITPAQAEGPYYPVDKPEDRDNDLTAVTGAAGAPAGQIVEFSGTLYDGAGMPVSGAVVEIWQTDTNGIYHHLGDPNTARRDMNFQFYGEAVTAVDGRYQFRTILPGEYEPRPRHIHVKVKLDGQELLTTQFYFEGDPALASEPMFNQTGGEGVNLIMSLVEGQDAAGQPILIGVRDIVLSTALSNN